MKYKLTIEIQAKKLDDLEQLLCLIAEEVVRGQVAGSVVGNAGSYVFSVEQASETQNL